MSGIDYYTKLMLHFNGTNNSTFIEDSSVYNKTVTANQNCIISTAQSKFEDTSCYLDSISHINTPSSSDWNFGEGDFTIDCWINFITTPSSQSSGSGNMTFAIWGMGSSVSLGNAYNWMFMAQDANMMSFWFIDRTKISGTLPSGNWQAGIWYHIAVVRGGSTLTFYLNGNSIGSSNVAGKTTGTTPYDLMIGKGIYGNPDIPVFLNGYVDEFRISKGVARWTTNFEPPTQAYTLASIIPQNTGGIDSSTLLYLYSNAQPNGNVQFIDRSQQQSAIIPNNTIGVTHSTTQTKFTSSSIKFNGTSFLMIPSNSIFDIGTSDFTLDSWFYVTSIPACSRTIARGGLEAVEGAWCFGFGTVWGGGTKINFAVRQGGANRDYSSPALTIPVNEWNHLALVRASETLYFFLNGLLIYTVSCPHTLSCAGEILTISARYSSSYSPIEFLSGYQDSIRFSNTARWTADFIPPTTLYTGNYIISGYVKEQTVPVQRIVRAHHRTTGAILQETISSNIDGSFTLYLVSNETCYVVTLDDNSGLDYNALIFDRISPE